MKKMIAILLAMFACFCLATACGDDDGDSGNACDKYADLLLDTMDKACAGDYADCVTCQATDEAADATEEADAEAACDEDAAQKLIDAYDMDAAVKQIQDACDLLSGMGDLTGGTDGTDTDSATE